MEENINKESNGQTMNRPDIEKETKKAGIETNIICRGCSKTFKR